FIESEMPSPSKRTSKGGVEQESKVKKAKEETTIVDVPMEESKKAVDPQDLYAIEDRIAAELGTSEMTDRLKGSTAVLREMLEKFIAGEPQEINMREALVSTIQMRRYSRLIYYANAINKKEVTTKMEAVESKYMQLQNQSSEIGHLQKEIDRCLQYPSNDEQISLIPVEEFYEKAKPEISRVEITKNDEHEQKVARLNWEREERKQLVGHLNELEFRRSVLISDINKKESRIKSLKPKMDTVVKSARSLEEALGMKSSSGDRPSPSFHLLPPPLSVLYVQAEAYKQLIEDTGVSVSVGGDTEEANRLNEKKEGEEEGEEKEKESEEMEGIEEGGLEDENEERKGMSVSTALEKKRNALLTPYPVYLTIEIGCVDDYKVRMKLQYLPELRISVLKWRVKASNLPSFGSFSSSSFMDDLFEGDEGLHCPNAVGAAKMSQLRVNFSSLSKSIGRPYQFVQKLTGDDNGGTQLGEELQRVMNAVRERMKRRVDGILALIEMDKGRLSQLMEREGLTMIEGVELKKVATISDEEYIAKIPQSTCDLLKKEETDPFLHLSFSFLTSMGEITVMCALWSDFPSSSPLVSFSFTKDGEVINEENSELLKSGQSRLKEKKGEEKKEAMVSLVRQLMEVVAEIGKEKEEKME
ncbi:hypothetical protein PFISCL1PPCAC_10609, partial [Pristionchus fissidentatus]